MKKTLIIVLAMTFLATLGLADAFAAQTPPPPVGSSRAASPAETPRDGPISISADHMTANDNSKVVTFSGRVIARQDDLIISCDVMRVHYQPRAAAASPTSSSKQPFGVAKSQSQSLTAAPTTNAPPQDPTPDPISPVDPKKESPSFSGGQEIERVECEGTVKIQQGDRLAVGQKALYLAKAAPRRLILTGDARVWQGRNAVTGHEVTYFLDENRSQVESQNNSRVRAFYERAPKKADHK